MRARASLASRISLLAVASALITAVLGGALAVGLIRNESGSTARSTLARLADAAQATADSGANAEAGQARARATLRVLKIQSAALGRGGVLATNSSLARASITSADVAQLLANHPVSAQRTVGGRKVLVEGRPTGAGGIVLVQYRADATQLGDQAIQRVFVALLVGVAIAMGLGLVVAFGIARPLRRTAQAAHALARGQRDVVVRAEGPAEVAEVGEAVNLLATALSHSEARQREFLLSVSHDLRTPLTAISGYAESLADGVIPAEDSSEVGAIMLAEARRLNRLVADLLDLARLGAQEFRVALGLVDVTAVARSAGAVWQDRCAANGVPFQLQVLVEPLWCRTDPTRLRQILDGLLENALRVTPAGAPIVLAVGSETAGTGAGAGARVVAEVRDGGPGLTDADLSVAFDRSALYERYRGVRQVGTGLGLAIVQGLAQRLGGTVEAGHSVEGGARFTVRLPVAGPPEDSPKISPGQPPGRQ